ncbi:MAG: CoA pyrophosphatase [Candidatus Kapabacteria bacterium]|nr:CoA pyrophosphatase [Candidatus Kapabacteria bacterium]
MRANYVPHQRESREICTMHFEQWIIQRLQRPLPGITAHEAFVPEIPDRRSRLMPPPEDARKSAVLIPLFTTVDGALHVVLTVRSEGLRNHRGQISFPGGRCDEGESATDAALREAHEEIGLAADRVRVLGQLTELYIPPSQSAVTPVVAMIQPPSSWTLSTHEVAEVLIEPVSTFLDPSTIQWRSDIIKGLPVDVPHWQVHPSIPLWGATAMMLQELSIILREYEMEMA